jgi:molybdopterin-guanine dinucleotide biosynthesis protein B
MKVLGLVGWSGSGKTSLIVQLLPMLITRGLTVSTLKHGHHMMDLDKPGKDTYRHREAGATEVMAASPGRWALMHELRGSEEPPVEELIARMTPVDLLLIEGFKTAKHDKLEVYRPALGKPLLCRDDAHIVAVASDIPLSDLKVPNLDVQNVPAIADFVVRHCDLPARVTA